MNRWQYTSAHDLGLEAKQRYCSAHRENGLTQTLVRLGWLSALRLLFKCWNRLEIRGLENVPAKPPFVITANHCSHLDALILTSALSLDWRDQISPLAAGDYFFSTSPSAGFSATVLNALPIWRNRHHGQRHGLSDLRDRLREQSAIFIVFPEGSRSRDGKLHEFKPGFATLIAGTNIPVIPCHLSGSFAALPPDKLTVRPQKIVLQIGKPMIFNSMRNDASGWRQICAVTHENTVALQAGEPAVTKARQHDWRDKLLLPFRITRLLLHRRLRALVTVPWLR